SASKSWPRMRKPAPPSLPPASEHCFEEVAEPALRALAAEQIAEVVVLDPHALPVWWRSEVGSSFPVLSELVVSIALLVIRQNLVGSFPSLNSFSEGLSPGFTSG